MQRVEITKQIANGGVVTIVVTTLLSAFVWFFPAYMFPEELPPVNFVFMGMGLFAIPAALSRILAFVFWFAVWLVVNSRCERLHIIPVRSVMPFVVGMAFVTAITEMQLFHSGMVALFFTLSALLTIFELYTVSNQVRESFKVIILILISSLFVPWYIWMLVLFFLGLAVFKVRSPRIFLSVLVALLVFVWIVWGICFSIGEASVFSTYLFSLVDFGFFNPQGNRIVHLVGLVVLFITMIVVMIALAGISHKFDARVRLNVAFIDMAFIFSVLLMAAAKGFNVDLLMVVALSVTMLSALFFSVQRNKFANILFLVSLALLLLFRVADGLIKYEI